MSSNGAMTLRRRAAAAAAGALSLCGLVAGAAHDEPRPGPWSAPPSAFRIGNAVAPIDYWGTAWTLTDLFKRAGFENEIGDTRPSRAWVPVIAGQWHMARRYDVPTDDLGWPTSLALADGQRADALTTIIFEGHSPGENGPQHEPAFPAGVYRVRWAGQGELRVEGEVDIVRELPQGLDVRYEGEGPLLLTITQTDPNRSGAYIRDVRVLRPDAVQGERFNRRYLDDLRPLAAIRPLHMLGDQLTYGPPIAWADRKPEAYSHWGGALGAPYEVAIDLANASASDLWLNVPVAAGDDFVRALAALVATRLDADRRVYVELGNELWNRAMPYELGRQQALARARARWPGVQGTVRPYSDGDPVSQAMLLHSWQGARTAEVGQVFREALGDQRVVVVLAGQLGASAPSYHPSRYLLESPVWVGEEGALPAAEHADAFAVAAYVHDPGAQEGVDGPWAFSRESPESFLRDAMAYVRGQGRWSQDADEPGMRWLIRSDRRLAEAFGLPLIAYEGGQHFTGSRFTRDAVNTHPMMADLYDALLDVWAEEGGGLFVHFAGVIPRGQSAPGREPTYFQSENFGVKERQTHTHEQAPKWRALRERMRELGQLP